MIRHCECCGIEENGINLHEHHLIPKMIGGTDADGRVLLCKICHDKIHNIIPLFMWQFVYRLKQYECQQHIKKKTLEMLRFKY